MPYRMDPRKLSGKLILELSNGIMRFDPKQDVEMNAKKGIGLNSMYLNMNQEMYHCKSLQLKARRDNMKELYVNDFLQEQDELAEVDLGFINTQP